MKKTEDHKDKTAAVLITAALCLILAVSLTALLLPASRGTDCVADIYQDGELLASIPLDGSASPRRFTVTGEGGCTNEIEVRTGSIGVVSASCPDRLCVRQGFTSGTSLPVVCLPNKLVIRLRENDSGTVDAIAR